MLQPKLETFSCLEENALLEVLKLRLQISCKPQWLKTKRFFFLMLWLFQFSRGHCISLWFRDTGQRSSWHRSPGGLGSWINHSSSEMTYNSAQNVLVKNGHVVHPTTWGLGNTVWEAESQKYMENSITTYPIFLKHEKPDIDLLWLNIQV